MKKLLSLAGSLLVLLGAKAQTQPAVKKETTLQPAVNTITTDTLKTKNTLKQTPDLKKTNLKAMKEKSMKELKESSVKPLKY